MYLLLLRLSRPGVPSVGDAASPLESASASLVPSIHTPGQYARCVLSSLRKSAPRSVQNQGDHNPEENLRPQLHSLLNVQSQPSPFRHGFVQHQRFSGQNGAPRDTGTVREAEGELSLSNGTKLCLRGTVPWSSNSLYPGSPAS